MSVSQYGSQVCAWHHTVRTSKRIVKSCKCLLFTALLYLYSILRLYRTTNAGLGYVLSNKLWATVIGGASLRTVPVPCNTLNTFHPVKVFGVLNPRGFFVL